MVYHRLSLGPVVALVSHMMAAGGQFQRVHTTVGPHVPSLAKVGRGAPDAGPTPRIRHSPTRDMLAAWARGYIGARTYVLARSGCGWNYVLAF